MTPRTPTGIIPTPIEMKSKCTCCSRKSQHSISIKCRYRPGYDDDKKVWTDLPAIMYISFCPEHLQIYQKNRHEHDCQYGVSTYVSNGKDWWDILDGVPGLPEYTYDQ